MLDTLVQRALFLFYLVFPGGAFATSSLLNIVVLPALVARLC